MVDKCNKFGVKNILSGLIFKTRVSLEVLEKIHEKRNTFCFGYGLIYVTETLEGYIFVKTFSIY